MINSEACCEPSVIYDIVLVSDGHGKLNVAWLGFTGEWETFSDDFTIPPPAFIKKLGWNPATWTKLDRPTNPTGMKGWRKDG